MLQFAIGFGVSVISVGVYVFFKKKRRDWLEQKQLEMFIESLVWDSDDHKWVVDECDQIKPIPTDRQV